MPEQTEDRNAGKGPASGAVPPPGKRTLAAREERTLPMRRVYLIVICAILLVLVVALIG